MIHVGKHGITPQLVEEVKRQVTKHKVVKVKFLRSSRVEKDCKQLAEELASATNTKLIEVRGFTCILHHSQ